MDLLKCLGIVIFKKRCRSGLCRRRYTNFLDWIGFELNSSKWQISNPKFCIFRKKCFWEEKIQVRFMCNCPPPCHDADDICACSGTWWVTMRCDVCADVTSSCLECAVSASRSLRTLYSLVRAQSQSTTLAQPLGTTCQHRSVRYTALSVTWHHAIRYVSSRSRVYCASATRHNKLCLC